jgi:pimeloyl-ACP methyl ester carboxylesterase
MDIARAAVGQAKLDYYGASYGTLLGLVYAQMWPHNVGRMVLDSVYSPTAPDDLATQALGFETTFQDMVQTCVDRGNCPMGSSRAAIMAKFDKLLDQLNSAPLPTGPGSPPLDANQLVNGLVQSLYQEAQWPSIEASLAALFDGKSAAAPNGTQAGQAAGMASGAGKSDEVSGSFQAIDCLTMPQDQRTVAAAQQGGQEARTVAPHFGSYVEQEWLNCVKWPVPSPANAGRAVSANGSPTILLVNNTYDPATPVTWARDVHGQLANSVLVTNVGGGHVFYPMGSCTHKVVDDFLVAGSKPAPGTACHNRNPGVAP